MIKASGIFLIMAGSVFLVSDLLNRKRHKTHLLLSLIQALHTIESSIRWKGQDVPTCLNELKKRQNCGIYFQNMLNLIESGNTLQCSWNQSFSHLNIEIYHILRQMEWVGDETQLLGNLQYISQSLTELYRHYRSTQHNENRLLIATVGSVAGFLIIILL